MKNDVIPPKIKIHWPRKGDEIYGKTFNLRGKLDIAAATVKVTGPNVKGIDGVVDHNGHFWFRGIPVQPGLNSFTLTATDAAGNSASETFEVVRSEIEVTIDPQPVPDPKTRLLCLTANLPLRGGSPAGSIRPKPIRWP